MATIISEDAFGSVTNPENPDEKQPIRRFTMTNSAGLSAQVISYGAALVSLKVPDQNGKLDDVVLGFDDINGYLGVFGENPYFGASIGRVSNRIANAKFVLDGTTYKLNANDSPHHLHGGTRGFDKRVWEASVDGARVTFSRVSEDKEENYPGQVLAQITYELTAENALNISYQAVATQPTPLALTNHSYFNLSGHQKADQELRNHFVYLNADKFTPVDETLIPTGDIESVNGTIFDFRASRNINDILNSGYDGFDHNWSLTKLGGEKWSLAARIEERSVGRILEVFTDQPGLQFYTGNFLPQPPQSLTGKNDARYCYHGAMCLETQNYPNAINQPNFPDAVIRPGQIYTHKVSYKFSTANF